MTFPFFGLRRYVLVIACVLASSSAHATARIGDELALRLSSASARDFVPVLVFLRDRVEAKRDLPELAYGKTSVKSRHVMIVDALQRKAAEAQGPLRAALAQAEMKQQVRDVHHYWLDNMIGLYATPELLSQLAARGDVERIEFLPDATIPEPEMGAAVAAIPGAHEPGLDVIGAPTLWAQGITGKGRLVCGIDTGVRGTHYALASRWRGLRVPVDQAWLDPRGLTTFPADIGSQSPSHGSHTMGTMVGADTSRGDTVGVAPDAEWIAAFGLGSTTVNTLDLVDCLEWAADPDGNPNTTDDVPDVLNCSWGFAIQGIVYPCNDILNRGIDNLEAAGVVVIWAAGNEGPTVGSVRYPANSTNVYSTNFSVGNVNSVDTAIYPNSSRGPSPCTGDPTKPEVVAPGVSIRSCVNVSFSDTSYNPMTGTSMSAPHVSGGAALLRQIAPNATPAQIKQALFVSAIDKGSVGDDNTYGNGLLNLPAAADSLAVIMGGPDLDIRVQFEQVTDDNDTLEAGDTVAVLMRLVNRSEAPATSAYLKLSSSDANVTVITDSTFVGIIPALDTSSAATALEFVISPTTPQGQPLELVLAISATGFSASRPLTYATEPAPVPGMYTHDNTHVTFTVTNHGLYGLANASYYPLGGSGFLYDPSPTNHLAEGALVLGTDAAHVSDDARRAGGANSGLQVTDGDFAVSPGGALETISNIGDAFQTTYCVFDDSRAESPIGVRIEQRSLIFPLGDDQGYVMLIYTIENISAGAINGLRVGILHDWDFPGFLAGADTTGFEPSQHIGFMFDDSQVPSGPYRGVAVLSAGGATAYRSIDPDDVLYDTISFEVVLTDSLKWSFLSGGIGPGSVGAGKFADAATFTGAGPFDLPNPGDTVQVAFAFVGSEDGLLRLTTNAAAARAKYSALFGSAVGDDEVQLPAAFEMDQNYPNPFNPETRIEYSLSRPGRVTLSIFNVAGQLVRTLANEIKQAGGHEVTWDGRDERGQSVASGVYFYRLRFEGQTQTRKMLLLR
jgi:subtilisin family serine protease